MVKKLSNINEILKVFEINRWKTIKQVSREIGLSYQPVYAYLAELSKSGLLRHKREGNVHLYSLELKNKRVVKELENIEFERTQKFTASIDKKIGLVLNEFLEQSQKNLSVWCVLLFGSTARKSETKKSDVDVFVVAEEGDEAEIKRICNTISMKYGLHLSLVVVSLDEFRKMLIERNEFTNNLISERIILYGFEFYFNELVKSMEKLKWI